MGNIFLNEKVKALSLLREGKLKLETYGICRKQYCRVAMGKPTYCMLGALGTGDTNPDKPDTWEAQVLLLQASNMHVLPYAYNRLSDFNDKSTDEEILSLYDKAIALAEKEIGSYNASI